MTIWLLALVLMASLAALGYRQGAIRVACSFVGILLGLVLAGPLSGPVKRLLILFGLRNPALLWLLAPAIVFVLVSLIAKLIALNVHLKVEVFYKYKAGDLRLALWERMNHRLGLCLGLLNGATYFLLICGAIFTFSYWTVQVANPEKDSKWLRLLNRMGEDLQSTSFAGAARAVLPMPQAFYDMADFAGFLYRNPLGEARLSHYPAYLSLAEQPDFQVLGNDSTFYSDLWLKQEPIADFLNHPRIKGMLNNPDLMRLLWETSLPNLSDIYAFLQTDKSAKYDDKIIGRWDFDANAVFLSIRRAKPNIPSSEMQRFRSALISRYAKAGLVATPEHQLFVKNLLSGNDTAQGQWQSHDGKYSLSFNGEELATVVDRDRLSTKRLGMDLIFSRED